MKVDEKQSFITSDLCLCASLLAYGYGLESVDFDNGNRGKAVFTITKDQKLDTLIEAYWLKNLQVEPLGFFSYLKEIKSRIYASKE